MNTSPELQARLVNWALSVREHEKQGSSATADFCERLAIERLGRMPLDRYRESKPRREVDEADGYLVEKAWRRCTDRHKALLLWHYVRNARPEVVCRKIAIPARPMEIYTLARYHAETEIGRHLSGPVKNDLTVIIRDPRVRVTT